MAHHLQIMEHQLQKSRSTCDLFDIKKQKWQEGEIIGSYSDAKGNWIKVRRGQTVHNLLAHDPNLRVRAMIQSDEVMELEHAMSQIPKIKPILNRILPTASGQGICVFAERES